MFQHECIIHVYDLGLILYLRKIIIFLYWNDQLIAQLNKFLLFKRMQFFGCYNSTPLKNNLVLEIQLVLTQTTPGTSL